MGVGVRRIIKDKCDYCKSELCDQRVDISLRSLIEHTSDSALEFEFYQQISPEYIIRSDTREIYSPAAPQYEEYFI
jgi:hypothetical protein